MIVTVASLVSEQLKWSIVARRSDDRVISQHASLVSGQLKWSIVTKRSGNRVISQGTQQEEKCVAI